jgi:hypothetical protein
LAARPQTTREERKGASIRRSPPLPATAARPPLPATAARRRRPPLRTVRRAGGTAGWTSPARRPSQRPLRGGVRRCAQGWRDARTPGPPVRKAQQARETPQRGACSFNPDAEATPPARTIYTAPPAAPGRCSMPDAEPIPLVDDIRDRYPLLHPASMPAAPCRAAAVLPTVSIPCARSVSTLHRDDTNGS